MPWDLGTYFPSWKSSRQLKYLSVSCLVCSLEGDSSIFLTLCMKKDSKKPCESKKKERKKREICGCESSNFLTLLQSDKKKIMNMKS